MRSILNVATKALVVAVILVGMAGTVRADEPAHPVPEIDPGTMTSALTLLGGGMLMLTSRLRKKA